MISVAPRAGDSFERIKGDLAGAKCVELEFIIILDSEVFDTVDSALGRAMLAHDGRYSVAIGEDKYIYDRQLLYSYSGEQKQVTVERIEGPSAAGVSFLIRLDEYYSSTLIGGNREYRLIKEGTVIGNMPDSMVISIDVEARAIERIEYFDVNDDLNTVVITSQTLDNDCDSAQFIPGWPEGTQILRLYEE